MKTDDAECEWCPVKLDASGVYIAPGEWGCCNDACPKTIDKGKKNTNISAAAAAAAGTSIQL